MVDLVGVASLGVIVHPRSRRGSVAACDLPPAARYMTTGTPLHVTQVCNVIMTVYSIQRQINLIEIRDTRVLLVYLEILVRFTTHRK